MPLTTGDTYFSIFTIFFHRGYERVISFGLVRAHSGVNYGILDSERGGYVE